MVVRFTEASPITTLLISKSFVILLMFDKMNSKTVVRLLEFLRLFSVVY